MDKKFIRTSILDDYEVLADSGWVNINAIHETIEYEEWSLSTQNFNLICADTHVVFDDNMKEVFVKDLKIGSKIQTKNGIELVEKCYKTNEKSNMYDLDLDDKSDHRYYTNDILSHNTYYIRYLLQCLTKINKKVLYFPPTMVQAVTDPSFFNFITTWTMDNGKNSILLIEDAEPLLSSRESTRNMGITNLLNLTDGILNDVLSIQIIATFNTSIIELDDALLRPERLIARKEFKKLNIDNAKKLAMNLKIDPDKITDEMTLAEIYSIKNDSDILIHGIDKKSAMGEKNMIGFSKTTK